MLPICVVVALAISPIALQKPADLAARPMLDGSWTLNKELSSSRRGSGGPDPADRRQGGGGMRGGFGGVGMGGGGGRNAPQDREEMERRRTLMREVLEAQQRFLITVEELVVTFTYPDGRVVRYKADGKEERHQYTSGTVKTKAKWLPDRLSIETDLGDGMKVTHTYKTTPEPRQLVVTTILPGQSKDLPPLTFTYDETVQ
jgi:hypothetical protein